jgi:predicted nuclease of restriction endonuclease-like (RecB) superfamily
MSMTLSNHDYANWLSDVKSRIATARSRAALAVNAELIQLYHHIGQDILRKQVEQSWGSKVIDRLARDLKEAFPDMKGFSARNLKYMRYFAEHCPSLQFGQQAAAQLPWFHIVTLLTKLSDAQQRAWYAEQVITQGWSRVSLERHIETQLMSRSGSAVSNFAMRLPSPTSQLAQETLKDPCLFDFLGLSDDAQEREIENALVKHITKVLLELGQGFAFVGQQQRVEVAGDEFFIDLLFYHIKLKCYVVVELKATAFKPEYIGQLNFYLSVVDAQLKAEDDNPTIGLLLCRKHNKLVAQYAVNGIDKPIGVADYHLLTSLPESLMINLPSIEALEQELEGIT